MIDSNVKNDILKHIQAAYFEIVGYTLNPIRQLLDREKYHLISYWSILRQQMPDYRQWVAMFASAHEKRLDSLTAENYGKTTSIPKY